MRILLSIHHELDRNSGAPGVTWQLANAWRQLGHSVDILSFSDMRGNPSTRRYRFPWFVASRVLRRPDYDVLDLSSGDGWVLSVLRRFLPRLRRPLLVARSHGLEHVVHDSLVAQAQAGGAPLSWKYPLYNGGYRLWECRTFFVNADLALFLNRHDLRVAIERLGVRAERAALVRNGIAGELLGRRGELSPSAEVMPQNIAFVGSYIARKGTETLRVAMSAVMQRLPHIRLGLFGTQRDAAEIHAEFPADLHDRICVVPSYGNAELFDLLRDFHILAFPSLSEGYPLAVGEAMACGLVPVVSDIPGPTEIVRDRVCGLVVPAGEPAALQAAIELLIGSPELWRNLRDTAIAQAAGGDWRTIAGEIEALFMRHAEARRELAAAGESAG
jgi:glycosyltransferase involved in cell wall biosynthesis